VLDRRHLLALLPARLDVGPAEHAVLDLHDVAIPVARLVTVRHLVLHRLEGEFASLDGGDDGALEHAEHTASSGAPLDLGIDVEHGSILQAKMVVV
jgi:hypothetical protein